MIVSAAHSITTGTATVITNSTTTINTAIIANKEKQTPWLSVRKPTIPTDPPPRPAKLVQAFAGRECSVVSATGPYHR